MTASRLARAVSPYLRAHAENPVPWWPWGEAAFAEARRRQVPVMVSIGYATCHWCHVMARESFSDPVLAAVIDARFVAVKVDREEHPEVDAVYLAAAGAFTPHLGWPLTVFTTPEGLAFYGGTYWPPLPVPDTGQPSFRQVLDAVHEAWTERRGEVLDTATRLAAALAAAAVGGEVADSGGSAGGGASGAGSADAVDVVASGRPPLGPAEQGAVVDALLAAEDRTHGGFGGAPKFPVAPVLRMLLILDEPRAHALALRTLRALAESTLRDAVEGGFFRYATRRDWSEPHYERMLYDNALLLDAYTEAWLRSGGGTDAAWAAEAAAGIAGFLTGTMQLPSGGFASAQDSESTVDGHRVEGGYYALDAATRSRQTPPALDAKVLAGWNGLAIGSLAEAGLRFDRPEWVAAAARAADHILTRHLDPSAGGSGLRRASLGELVSAAAATLEDHGMLADGLLRLAAASGRVRYAVAARALLDAVLAAGMRAPGGGDPVLEAHGQSAELDPSEGAYPSGRSATAGALLRVHGLTAEARYRSAAVGLLAPLAEQARERPLAFGTTLGLLAALGGPARQLVLVEPTGAPLPGPGGAAEEAATDAADLRATVRRWPDPVLLAVVDPGQAEAFAAAGFELFAGRIAIDGAPTAYLCTDSVCRLPTTTASGLR